MIYVIATTPMKPENKDDFIKGAQGLHRRDAQGEGLHFLWRQCQRQQSEPLCRGRALGDPRGSQRPR